MKNAKIDKLINCVAPLKKIKNKGNDKLWKSIKEQVDLPDWLFPFFNTYGSGAFVGYDGKGGYLDYIAIMNVFERPFLKRHRAIGEAFSQSNKISRLPVRFFPEFKDGLFPIAKTDQTMFLLIDPKNVRKVYTTDNHVYYFTEIDHNYVDYLLFLFEAKKSEFWSIPKKAKVSRVTVVESVFEAQRIPRADYYE
jgi:hypothetical protein